MIFRSALAAVLACLLLTACGRDPAPPASSATATGSAATAANAPMEADLARTLREQADFYTFKPLAELPANLAWQDGADLPEFADPAARKGGTYTTFIPDFPRTLRTIGPDATGGIRAFLLDYVEPRFIERHPNLPDAGYPGPPIVGDRLAVFGRRFLVLAVEPQMRGPDAIAFSLTLQG